MTRHPLVLRRLSLLLGLGLAAMTPRAQEVRSTATAPFPNFESGPTRPLLLAPDGRTLYALNTPDHRVEVYDVSFGDRLAVRGSSPTARLQHRRSIFTGLEPVSLALHPDDATRLFVANRLSDSVSVVDLGLGHVVATIPVGDEPSDLALAAGTLVVTCARAPLRRGDLLDPGPFDENAVVFVSADPPYAILGQVALPAHEPRALVAAGELVYVVPRDSGNHTTSLGPREVEDLGLEQLDLDAFDQPFAVNGALASPDLDTAEFVNTKFLLPFNGWTIPTTGRIVFDHEYPGIVPQLPDNDVLVLDAAARTLLPTSATGVGTTLLDIDRAPDGRLWIVGTDARNRTRFERAVQGAAADNRITIVAPDGQVDQILSLAPPLTSRPHAQPVAIAFYDGALGTRAYVAALGTSTVLAIDAQTRTVLAELDVAELPIGLAVDSAHDLLYVLTLGDRSIQVHDIAAGHRPGRRAPLAYDPEPLAVSAGRIHLYDAREETGAGNGSMSCATCHVFGHGDFLAWDLGDPEGGIGNLFPDLAVGPQSLEGTKLAIKKTFMTHPMKGPMVTQSLRGLGGDDGPPLHWRGDRRLFQMFRGAFVGLLGGQGITPLAMQEYAGFVRSIVYPPNPFEPADREYRDEEATGRDLFGANPAVLGKVYQPLAPGLRCVTCHSADFAGGTDFTGSRPSVLFDGEGQLFNTAQLRGAYEKEFRHLTGFGVFHDGSVDSVRDFLDLEVVGNFEAFPALSAAQRDAVTAFVRAWDTGTAPLVGRQLSAPPASSAELSAFLDLAEARARLPAPDVDLIAKVHVSRPPFHGPQRGVLFADDGTGTWGWRFDTGPVVDRALLLQLVDLGWMEATFTCVPPGTGTRLGIDRDEDGLLDGEERGLGTLDSSPDTDQDGYDDALELALGADPSQPDAHLPGDVSAPTVNAHDVRDVFADTATLHLVLDEPGAVVVDVGTTPTEVLASFTSEGLARVHDVHLAGLPAQTALSYRVVCSDKNGNASTLEDTLTTGQALYHVEAIELSASASAPYTVTGRVLVADQAGAPVPDISVKVVWAGDLGGADFFPAERTAADGWATFVLGPYTPAGPTTVTLSPVFLGLNVPDAYFIGEGGDVPTWFYNPSANTVSYRSLVLP